VCPYSGLHPIQSIEPPAAKTISLVFRNLFSILKGCICSHWLCRLNKSRSRSKFASRYARNCEMVLQMHWISYTSCRTDSFQFDSECNQPVKLMSGARSSTGRLFQMRGPWTAKLRLPYFVLVLGMSMQNVGDVPALVNRINYSKKLRYYLAYNPL